MVIEIAEPEPIITFQQEKTRDVNY